MALIRCRECHREISSEAAACPGCGAPGPHFADKSPGRLWPAIELQDEQQILRLLEDRKKIEAIKVYRKATQCGLAEAKLAIELRQPHEATPGNGGYSGERKSSIGCAAGCGLVIAAIILGVALIYYR